MGKTPGGTLSWRAEMVRT